MGSSARLSLRHALALGLAHGPTELLPISSSAHTILIPYLAGWPYGELDPDLRSVESHPALGRVLRRLAPLRPGRTGSDHPASRLPGSATAPADFSARQALLVVLSFIPPAVVGYTFEQPLQRRLSGPSTIVAGLLLGGAAMALADARIPAGTRTLEQASALDGLLLGLAQTLALIPGVSRSGAVLTAVHIPVPPAGHGYAYEKLKRKIGDYATAAAAVVLTMTGGKVGSCSIGLTNVAETPLWAEEAAKSAPGVPRPWLPALAFRMSVSAIHG